MDINLKRLYWRLTAGRIEKKRLGPPGKIIRRDERDDANHHTILSISLLDNNACLCCSSIHFGVLCTTYLVERQNSSKRRPMEYIGKPQEVIGYVISHH